MPGKRPWLKRRRPAALAARAPAAEAGFDPAQFRQMIMDRLKEQLGATDDEWKVLEPKLEKVMTAQRENMGGFAGLGMLFGGGGRPRGPFAPAENETPSPLAKASEALQAAIKDPNTDAKQYAAAMAAFRDARDSARKQLVDAQKDLKDVLTAKQEAVLLGTGLID